MSKELSDKTSVLVTSLGKFWLTENQREQVVASLGAVWFNLEGNLIMTNTVRGIISGDRLRELDKEKQGEWKCKFGYWHHKGEKCAHAELERIRG